MRRHGVGIERLFRHDSAVDRSALEAWFDLLFGVDTYGSALFSGDPDIGQPGAGASELNDMMDGPFGAGTW